MKDVLVCGNFDAVLNLPDNRIGKCHECGCKVQYRPQAPRLKKLCLDCALPRIRGGAEVTTTPQMVVDFLQWRRNRKH